MEEIGSRVEKAGELSRRHLGVISAAAGAVVSGAVPAMGALSVATSDATITTADGTADAIFARPSSGAHPGVLFWPDAYGLRPTVIDMANRLASEGYAVLAINPYYRVGKAPQGAGMNFSDPNDREKIMGMMKMLTDDAITSDAKAYVGFLDSQASVNKKAKIGTQGYCMGGRLTMITAATAPDRIGAGASFHGGSLTTDKPNSPHLLAPKIRAKYMFAIGDNDDQADPESKVKLKDAFDTTGNPADIEVYKGALHGWCMKDLPHLYNEAAAEKAWSRLLAHYKSALV